MTTNPEPTGVDDRQITSSPVVDQKQGFVNSKPTGDYGELLARLEMRAGQERFKMGGMLPMTLLDEEAATAIRTLLAKVEQLERGS